MTTAGIIAAMLPMPRMLSLLLCALAALATPAVAGDAAPNEGHARIAAERRTLNAQFDAEERACRQRFTTTACVDDVRLRRRQALAPVRQQELALDDAERRQRVADRVAAVAAKQRTAAARAAAAAASATSGASGALAASSAVRSRQPMMPARGNAGAAPRAARHDETEVLRQVQAAERARTSAQRRAEAQAAQAHVAEREARLAARNKAKGKPTDTLPTPLPAATAAETAPSAARR